MSKVSTRNFVLTKHENFKLPSKGLILGWKLLHKLKKPITPKVVINGFVFDIPLKDDMNISVKEIREYIRDLLPETPYQSQLISMERVFFAAQLNAMEHYKGLTKEDFYNSFFTAGFEEVHIDFGKNKLKEIRIEETYYERKSENV